MPNSEFLAHNSIYMENFLRHAFLFEITRHLLLFDPPLKVSILNAEVDDSGIDLVLALGSVTRHIQMKTLSKTTTRNPYNISRSLFTMPGGCVIWMCYDPATLTTTCYQMLGEPGNKPIDVDLTSLPVGTRRKRGKPVEREEYVQVRIRQAKYRDLSVEQLVQILFDSEVANWGTS